MLRQGSPHALVAASTLAAMAEPAAAPRPPPLKRPREAPPEAPPLPGAPAQPWDSQPREPSAWGRAGLAGLSAVGPQRVRICSLTAVLPHVDIYNTASVRIDNTSARDVIAVLAELGRHMHC